MPAIKMITIDLDGTLLRSDGSVSDRTVRTLQAARDKGVVVAIATGRMYQTARPYGERLGLGDSPLLLFAGGLIETLESKKILFQQVIPREWAQELADLALRRGWQLQTYIDDVLRAARDDEWIRDYERITHSKACICGDDFYHVQGDCNKLLSRGGHDDLVARKALIEKTFPGRFNVLFSAPTFLEIMPQGVDKGEGIRRLGELYGIGTDEIMALGDSQNDLDMLKAAGFPVAMANAAEEVKAAAAYVTASNDDDGVAAAVEKFVL
ncbi:Cof-type HAD-IIB family hydrolase [Megasphaera elsdenii]|uniref:Cof-type HAD-IIB family hydrolase n=1 Tax=Megasphaera elsdenii TaxID=907 RepID=UPI002E79ACF8|nr:Cof-type HAD-IIB family hydrolase [Megasphaera elsdenii]MEE0404881.1 Cof-type HAD-IIB family hydrolase [Megasphaera elsdenii]